MLCSFHLGGQLINAAASQVLHHSVLPGYRGAARRRILAAENAENGHDDTAGEFNTADFILRRSRIVAHQAQPTSANRYAPGLVDEWQLKLYVLVDMLADKLCGRGEVRLQPAEAPVDAAVVASAALLTTKKELAMVRPQNPLGVAPFMFTDGAGDSASTIAPGPSTLNRRHDQEAPPQHQQRRGGWLRRLNLEVPADPLQLPPVVLSTGNARKRRSKLGDGNGRAYGRKAITPAVTLPRRDRDAAANAQAPSGTQESRVYEFPCDATDNDGTDSNARAASTPAGESIEWSSAAVGRGVLDPYHHIGRSWTASRGRQGLEPQHSDRNHHRQQQQQQPSRAYWPLPALSEASVACAMIDAVCGYPVQTYAVKTVDGYILTLIRMPRVESCKVAFFQHGLLDSASAWVSTGNVHSLAARAYQAGFDVFLGNLRGTNDALGDNGMGANPADWRATQHDDDGVHDDGAEDRGTPAAQQPRSDRDATHGNDATVPVSPLRGSRARAHTISSTDVDAASNAAAASRTVAFVGGKSNDGIPVHESLHPSQAEYWNYSVDDHALDVMAFMRQIRIIKALERGERAYLQRMAKANLTGSDPGQRAEGAPASSMPSAEAVTATNTDVTDDGTTAVAVTSTCVSRESVASSDLRLADDVSAALHSHGDRYRHRHTRSSRDPDSGVQANEEQPDTAGDPRGHNRRVSRSIHSLVHSASVGLSSSASSSPLEQKQASPSAATPTQDSRDASTTPGAQIIDASSSLADDVKIVAIGHSMGGAVLMLHILHSNALCRPHWLSKIVLLSPAGYHKHVPVPARVLLSATAALVAPLAYRPFPSRNSTMQQILARVLQDAKQGQATGDVLASFFGTLLGGESHSSFTRHVSFTEYPIGGTSTKVVVHGVQNMRVCDWRPFDYGKKENIKRYGETSNGQGLPPSYRSDYALFDCPVHIVAGGKDQLIPVTNLESQHAMINAVRPGLATLTVFDDQGHLDFTLGLDDAVISHVLREIQSGAADVVHSTAAAGVGEAPPSPSPALAPSKSKRGAQADTGGNESDSSASGRDGDADADVIGFAAVDNGADTGLLLHSIFAGRRSREEPPRARTAFEDPVGAAASARSASDSSSAVLDAAVAADANLDARALLLARVPLVHHEAAACGVDVDGGDDGDHDDDLSSSTDEATATGDRNGNGSNGDNGHAATAASGFVATDGLTCPPQIKARSVSDQAIAYGSHPTASVDDISRTPLSMRHSTREHLHGHKRRRGSSLSYDAPSSVVLAAAAELARGDIAGNGPLLASGTQVTDQQEQSPTQPESITDAISGFFQGYSAALNARDIEAVSMQLRRIKEGWYDGHVPQAPAVPSDSGTKAQANHATTIASPFPSAGGCQGRAWMPASQCALKFPWLRGFSKAEVVLAGLDAEAAEMGLIPLVQRS